MKSMKITAIALAVIMLISLFAACDTMTNDPVELQANAALKLLEAPYIMTMDMKYSSDNEDVDKILSAAGSSTKMEMNIDGTNFIMTVSALGQDVDYTFYDGYIYMDIMGMKYKTEIDKEDAEDMIGSGMSGLNDIDVDLFESVEVKTEDGVKTITCKGFKETANETVNSLLESLDEISDGDVTIKKEDFMYIVLIDEEGRFKSVDMIFSVNLNIDGEAVTVTYNAEIDFDYEKAVKVTLPEDADEYKDSGNMFG